MNTFDKAYLARPFLFGKESTPELMYVIEKFSIHGEALELGCGDGRDTFHLLQKGFSITAVDQSQNAINTLRFRDDLSSDEKKRLNTLCANVNEINLDGTAFDFVYAITLLDHLDKSDGEKLIKRIIPHIRSGGYIFIKVHTIDDVGNTHASEEVSEFASEIKHFYSTDELITQMIRYGKVVYYLEASELDTDHGAPHTHAFASILIKKG